MSRPVAREHELGHGGDAPAGPGHVGPSLPARALMSLRRGSLDRALSEGADPLASQALAHRAAQLTSARTRQRLADTLEQILIDATRAQPARSAAVRPPRGPIDAARLQFAHIIGLLRSPGPVYCQGVAMLRRLLGDGAGALYCPAHASALADELSAITLALEGRKVVR